MEQLVSASVAAPRGSFGAFLRACRHQALLSQEQLAARAGLSERTVRDLETGRVRSPRAVTVRLLADALRLAGPQRESWFVAARGVSRWRAGPGAGGPAQSPDGAPGPLPWRGCDFGGGSTPRRGEGSVGEVAPGVGRVETAARARAGPEAGAGRDGGLTSAERRELAALRRENRRLREGVEVLLRATAILTTGDPVSTYPVIEADRADSATPSGRPRC